MAKLISNEADVFSEEHSQFTTHDLLIPIGLLIAWIAYLSPGQFQGLIGTFAAADGLAYIAECFLGETRRETH